MEYQYGFRVHMVDWNCGREELPLTVYGNADELGMLYMAVECAAADRKMQTSVSRAPVGPLSLCIARVMPVAVARFSEARRRTTAFALLEAYLEELGKVQTIQL